MGILYKLKKVYESISLLDDTNIDMSDMKKDIIQKFNKWKSDLESLPVSKDNFSMFSPYYVLIENEWLPVINGIENTQGGLAWDIKEDEGTSSGSSRIGHWAHIGVENKPFIELEFRDILNTEDIYIKN